MTRFLDPDDIARVAPIVLQALQLPSDPKGTIGRYRMKLLTCMCRELEKLVRLGKSKRAQDNADALGLGNLSAYAWANRSKIVGKHEEGFHFEHTVTVSELVKRLLKQANPTLTDVERIIATAQVTWVTSHENKELDRLGYKYKRPDWEKAYQDAGITLIED